jgi:hypothetical protein
MHALNPQERRKTRRLRMGQPVRIRPSDPKDKYFEDTNTTKNVSRDGIYFVTKVSSYYEGMRLFVIVPHHMPRDPQDKEYLGQVVRVDPFPESQWGIAVQFLSDWRAG